MSVPKGKRNESRFEAQHHFYRLRKEVTDLMLLDFGFSVEKYQKQIEHYRSACEHTDNADEITARYQKKCDSFNKWFIDKECDAVIEMLRNIEREFTLGNSIYPTDTPAKLSEFIERRKHIDNAIGWCYVLKQEINYIIRTLPVDLNKYERFADSIDQQVKLYKGVRKADNRLLKTKKGEIPQNSEMKDTLSAVVELLATRLEA